MSLAPEYDTGSSSRKTRHLLRYIVQTALKYAGVTASFFMVENLYIQDQIFKRERTGIINVRQSFTRLALIFITISENYFSLTSVAGGAD